MTQQDLKKSNNPILKIVSKGINGLLHLVADMDRRGVSEEINTGVIMGKTKDGNDVSVKYKYGVKLGLDDVVKSNNNNHDTGVKKLKDKK
jgi:hypothetical protein